jgi:hypothetical protein
VPQLVFGRAERRAGLGRRAWRAAWRPVVGRTPRDQVRRYQSGASGAGEASGQAFGKASD